MLDEKIKMLKNASIYCKKNYKYTIAIQKV